MAGCFGFRVFEQVGGAEGVAPKLAAGVEREDMDVGVFAQRLQ